MSNINNINIVYKYTFFNIKTHEYEMLYMYINMLLDLFLYILNDQLDSIDLRKV